MIPTRLLSELEKERPDSLAVPLLTLDEEGFCHVAMLSYWELLADHGRLYFFIGASSRSARRLRERGVCTLIFADTSGVAYLKGWPSLIATAHGQALFVLTPRSYMPDAPAAEEGPVILESGIRFRDLRKERRLNLREQMKKLIRGRTGLETSPGS